MSIIEKLQDVVIIKLDEDDGSLLEVYSSVQDDFDVDVVTLSIKDVRDLFTELNELHTQMVINHHKELLDNKKK